MCSYITHGYCVVIVLQVLGFPLPVFYIQGARVIRKISEWIISTRGVTARYRGCFTMQKNYHCNLQEISIVQ
jgi:hypothetical protein